MNRNIKQVYIQYTKWEDFLHGMWRKVSKEDEVIFLKQAIEFTGNHVVYGNAMGEVIKEWKNTMLNSLTNPHINKRAFLGHCAVSFKINCPEYITRMAWKELNDKQRLLADNVAQNHINKWLIQYYERTNKRLHKNMGKQMLFEWYS